MLHFSNGLKARDWLENGFQLGNDQYTVSHLIQYKQNPNHFIFWTREPNGNSINNYHTIKFLTSLRVKKYFMIFIEV